MCRRVTYPINKVQPLYSLIENRNFHKKVEIKEKVKSSLPYQVVSNLC